MAGTAGGRSSTGLIKLFSFLIRAEAGRLQPVHGVVAAAQCHQLIMGSEFDYPAALEHADAVGAPDGGKAVGNEDRGRVAGGFEDAVEYLRLATHVELSGR